MKVEQIRQKFLDFFVKNQHTLVKSSSLVPTNDDTLLFTNAGMVQFKDNFLGFDQSLLRACSSQRCVRAGGKHNDLDNVGYTARHHTFFEMLGNFSFGDYFKKEAIFYAWQFLTEELKLPKEKLWVTVYQDDAEAAQIWLEEVGVPKNRISYCGEKDNFWSMGDTGPCGPCSEIFYDHGPEVAGGPPGSAEEDGDRYIEIWNLVFMQYNRTKDGKLENLPKPSVDTGMGLERIAAVMQHVHNNYETDLFAKLIEFTANLLGVKDKTERGLRVLADHIRSVAFLIADGVLPSNEGRGYVLRRIMRRAIRHGNKLGANGEFFFHLVEPLIAVMGQAYPELREKRALLVEVITKEEQQFAKTLETGMKILDKSLAEVDSKLLPGDIVFKLYDTYGFPTDLTADIAREKGIAVDMQGFTKEMEIQKSRAKAASKFDAASLNITNKTEFLGYSALEVITSVEALFSDAVETEVLVEGQQGSVVLPSTPFYAESGGQVGDLGKLTFNDGVFVVEDVTKVNTAHVHIGYVEQGKLRVGDKVTALVDMPSRLRTAANHSATHLLHAVLRDVLGVAVEQKGSLVDPQKLRFDFSYNESLTDDVITLIEHKVNQLIWANSEVMVKVTSMDEAKNMGAMALFGEKYGKEVRVLSMAGGYSVELCGGTHVKRTGDIGLFKITTESSIAAGIRRIEAVTNYAALQLVQVMSSSLGSAARLLQLGPADALDKRLAELLDKSKRLDKEAKELRSKCLLLGLDDLAKQAVDMHGVKVLLKILTEVEAKELKALTDELKAKLGKAIVVLALVDATKGNYVVGVTDNCTDKISAKEIVIWLNDKLSGKGGGRKDFAQAGFTEISKLPGAMDDLLELFNLKLRK